MKRRIHRKYQNVMDNFGEDEKNGELYLDEFGSFSCFFIKKLCAFWSLFVLFLWGYYFSTWRDYESFLL